MDKGKLINYLYWIMIIAVILTCFYISYILYTGSTKCMENPLKYQQIKMGKDYICTCYNVNPYGFIK